MSDVLFGIGVVLLILFVILAIRIGIWHEHEEVWWFSVDIEVMFNPDKDSYYTALLFWAKHEKPSLLGRVKKWETPEVRFAKSKISASGQWL